MDSSMAPVKQRHLKYVSIPVAIGPGLVERDMHRLRRTGALILKRAPEVPARQIAENSAGDGGVVVEKIAPARATSASMPHESNTST